MTETKKIGNLKDLFSHVRLRPGMYLGTNTISKLYDYLQGYSMAYWTNEIDNAIDKNFFDNFNEYVYKYYGVITNDNWKGVILEQCFGNETFALETFFKIFDLFIDEVEVTDSKSIVLNLFDKLVLQQEVMKNTLGENYSIVLIDTLELIKDNAISNLKSDFDNILEQINEKAEHIPEFKALITELTNK